MDERTIAHYQRHAREIAESYENAVPGHHHHRLLAICRAGMRVLDVGCGSGRDVALLRAQGVDAQGLDAAPSMIEVARARHPESAAYLNVGALPELNVSTGPYDLVMATAVLMHVPGPRIFDAALQLREQVRPVEQGRPGGQLLISIPVGRRGDPVEQRDADGRLFHPYSAKELQVLFERLGFVLLESREDLDSLGRGFHWHSLLFSREAGNTAVREIEAVIWKDRKVSTYKFALLRALCEIAQSMPKASTWRADGSVGVPLGLVVSRWLHYYWSFVESRSPVEQSTGDPPTFWSSLSSLASECRSVGGLTTFGHLIRGEGLPANLSRLAWKAAGDVARAIIRGPIAHAREGGLFNYERGGRRPPVRFTEADLLASYGTIVVPGSIWRELTLLGHWIGESIVLRWAEMTRDLTDGEVPIGEALELLLARPDPDRETSDARDLFLKTQGLRCVWSGRELEPATLNVDHLIPFSIWRNNDLWNLMPAHGAVNLKKRDRLVTLDGLRSRRKPIVATWDLLRARYPSRFSQEVRQSLHPLAAAGPGALDLAWSGLLEAVETTAIQRGLQRWTP